MERSEGHYLHDAKVIASLKQQVDSLHCQLRRLRKEYSEVIADAEVKYATEKSIADEQRHKVRG